MKNFSKNGAKFAAAIAMSVMALGYTTSVWAEDIKDSYTATGLDIDNGEQLNISEKNGLFIGCRAIAKKKAEGIGINVNGAQADFDINGHFGVLAQGCIEGTEANVSIKAVGFSGEKGSSLIKAGSVGYVASNEDHRGISTGTLVEESLGMSLNNYAMNIFAEKDINIYSFILNNTELTGENSNLVVDGFVVTSGTTTLNNAKIYMYDTNNAEAGFHALQIRNLDIAGSNELFLRADSSKKANISSWKLNSDVIVIKGIGTTITGAGKFDVNVFDKGMKNGYGMGADGEKTLNNPITVLYNSNSNPAVSNLINSVNDMHYDNGIWSYAYKMDAEQDEDGNVVIKKVDVKAAPSASGSQRSLHSANKAAGALAIGVLGNDSALREHLREVREHKDNENVWAKYHGGKLKSDGLQLKYNGVELGYDAYVGNDWTFGVSGMQTRGNTQLDSGSGKAKTNVGTVYGAWQGGSTYLNLEAKAGRVSSESKTFGGTVLQKIAGEFSAPAYSVSAEYGSTHELPAAWYLEPAVRLSYVHMGAADYGVQVQDTLARVANDSLDSFILRGGAKLGRRLGAKGSFYVKAAAVYDFGGDLATTVSADGRTAHYEDSLGGWGVEYGAGMEYKLGKAANISLDVERRSGGELKRDWGVNVGVNYSF